jgi:hypothetical protein
MKTYDAEICEWGNELVRVVPFIYHLHQTGEKVRIETTKGMRPFYFFLSEEDVIIKYPNRWKMNGIHSKDIPKQNLYDDELDYEKWTPPPYKRHYQKQKIEYPSHQIKNNRPTLIISNKYNKEWLWEGINAIPLEILDRLFSQFKATHNIIYNRLRPELLVVDSDTLPHESYADADVLARHPHVCDMNTLYQSNKHMDISTFQLVVFSHAEKFLNVQGGLGHFAAFFGGKQVFYLERNGHKHIEHSKLKRLQSWHTKLGGAQVQVADSQSIEKATGWLAN